MYTYATLDLRPTADAQEANRQILAGPVLGVEVTVPALAQACSLGNIDPQHLGGDAQTAAIEAALDWPLPPTGATLATVRPDADALGAMAVLLLRAGRYRLTEGARQRVALIAAADKEAAAPWPGPRPAPSAEELLSPATPVMHLAADHTRPLGRRVDLLAEWLRLGEDSPAGTILAGYRDRALAEAQQALDSLQVTATAAIAVVVGSHRLAMGIGYRYAPVVVATNPAFSFAGGPAHRKHTVARWRTGTLLMEWEDLRGDLNEQDPATTDTALWGGSSSIIGSPMGVASGLSTDQVVAIVRQHVLDGLQQECWELERYADHYAALAALGESYDTADAALVQADQAWVVRALADEQAACGS
ncbi:hypothetical protein [Streptosporangium canum]|uniref:hypothetical protein n=1 Tax=Streptosporangium canum TaxID=324952 RepID=UPI0037976764